MREKKDEDGFSTVVAGKARKQAMHNTPQVLPSERASDRQTTDIEKLRQRQRQRDSERHIDRERAGHAQHPPGEPQPVPVSAYRGTSLIRKDLPPGPYRRPLCVGSSGCLGGGAFSYERGTSVCWALEEAWRRGRRASRPCTPPPR